MGRASGSADPRRSLPAVDVLAARARELALDLPERVLLSEARRQLDSLRAAVGNGAEAPGIDAIARSVAVAARLVLLDSPRPLINATGVIIHTNLGRAPLSEDALAAVHSASQGYSDLEFNLGSGARGSRRSHVEGLLCELAGSEAALVLNNNAGAVFLCLSALARGRDVLVSRGEAVEIGDSFRIPEILAQSGARLVDVGATNRTRLSDYEDAAGPDTALFMKVHRSNFTILGFTEEVPLADLCTIARRRGVAVMNDLGSGSFIDTVRYGLEREPKVQDSVAAGADLTTFSGDKLLGGPQAGIVVGRRDLLDRVSRHPLARALRPDKMCLAGLRATLLHYLKGEAEAKIPVWQMIAATVGELEARASSWGSTVATGVRWELVPGRSTIGGGSLPGQTLPTVNLCLHRAGRGAAELAAGLRKAEPPVVARIEAERVYLDPRTVLPRDDGLVKSALSGL